MDGGMGVDNVSLFAKTKIRKTEVGRGVFRGGGGD